MPWKQGRPGAQARGWNHGEGESLLWYHEGTFCGEREAVSNKVCGSDCICSIVHFLASRGHCESLLQRRCYCQRVVLDISLKKFLVLYMIQYSEKKKKKVWIFAVSLAGRKRKIPLIRFAFKDISKLFPWWRTFPISPALCKASREENSKISKMCDLGSIKRLWNWSSLGWGSAHMISFRFSQVGRGWEDWVEEMTGEGSGLQPSLKRVSLEAINDRYSSFTSTQVTS